jgi:hypothetical protein
MKSYYQKSIVGGYFIGVLFAFLGFPAIMLISSQSHETPLGYLLFFIWASLLTLRRGVKIDFKNRKIIFFNSYLWIPISHAKKVEDFSNFKIIGVNKAYRASSRATTSTLVYKKTGLELYDSIHKKYRRIAVAETDEIKELAEKIRIEFNIERLKK